MVQNGTFVPRVLMQGEIELVIYLKYLNMRIFNDIICRLCYHGNIISKSVYVTFKKLMH